jgi:alpha-glucosidase (family GH31 glycosyl hydrolase)
MIFRLRRQPQPDAVMAGSIIFQLQLQTAFRIHEQFSYFDLRGKPFPLWTSEQGVGRNKQTYVTWQADHVAAVIHVAVVLLGAHEGRLREEGPVVVTTRVLSARRISTSWRSGKITPRCASNVHKPTSICWKN